MAAASLASMAVEVALPATLNLPEYRLKSEDRFLSQRLSPSFKGCDVLEIHRLLPVSAKVFYGALITGYVFVTPREKLTAGMLEMEIVCVEFAASNNAARLCKRSHRDKWHKGYGELATMKSSFSNTTIAIGSDADPLCEGYQYAVPFCLEFPDPHSLVCECGVPHHVLPPESEYISYHVEARLAGSPHSATLPLKVRPGTFHLDLSKYYDADNRNMSRVYSQTLTISRQYRLWNIGSDLERKHTLTFSSPPINHDVSRSSSGIAKIDLSFDTMRPKDVRIHSVLFYVFKIFNHAPRGVGKYIFNGPGRFHKEELIAYGESQVTYSNEPSPNLSVSYSLTGEKYSELTPSYVGCLTSITYALDFFIDANRETARLRLPLVLSIGALPRYEDLVPAPPPPTITQATDNHRHEH